MCVECHIHLCVAHEATHSYLTNLFSNVRCTDLSISRGRLKLRRTYPVRYRQRGHSEWMGSLMLVKLRPKLILHAASNSPMALP